MARNTRRMALYEAISQSRKKQAGRESRRQKIVRLRSGFLRKRKEGSKSAKTSVFRSGRGRSTRTGAQRLKTRIGLSYMTALLIALGLIVIVLAGIKLGQFINRSGQEAVNPGAVGNSNISGNEGIGTDSTQNRSPSEPVENGRQENDSFVSSSGQNVIVIASYGKEADLIPVQTHFAEQGIATEIRSLGDNYLLVTRQRYGNPNRRDSDGYAALQRIKEIGATYKAPSDYEPFGSRPFQDAYGRKVWWE
ncbi:MAG: hypothetical protein JXA82_00520 [Sedimentisphaerales bacterium]|nr:hypothetical protein [Sedimentisphaerales bacterium]